MKPMASSYPKGTSYPSLTKSKAVFPMYLKPNPLQYLELDVGRMFDAPVRHSTNLKPSTLAIASSIFELTVEATIATFDKSVFHVDLDLYCSTMNAAKSVPS